MRRRSPVDVRLDMHRRRRRGIPEIILGAGKTPRQLIRIGRRMLADGEVVLITRLAPEVFADIARRLRSLQYHPVARIAFHVPTAHAAQQGLVIVVTGGTSDVPMAEEAAVTLEVLGSRVARLYDVGVAGVHRILQHQRLLQRASAIVVVAGMEGALASVVAGLVRCPVVAVPTSVGYGASFEGLAALLAMLNSCVPGIGVVNIDNGFGAGYLAHVINAAPKRSS